jgi:3-mercaptopyruvate sulfurtransferase SseA
LLPETGAINRMFSAIGLNNADRVIVYDETGGPAAARLVWTLRISPESAQLPMRPGWNRNASPTVNT